MSGGRNGLRKQVTEAKGGPLELRREEEARKTYLGARRGVGEGGEDSDLLLGGTKC